MAGATISTVPAAAAGDAYGPQGRSEWLDIDWREHLRWALVDGRALNYVDMGSGEKTVVFIHGLSGSWQNWLENIPFFASRGYRVIAPDLPGFGHSEMPREKISIHGYARAIDTLLDQLGIERVSVVGNSMGGFTGAELAISFSTRVEKLVLVSAAGLTTHDRHNDTAMAALYRAEAFLAHASGFIAKKSDNMATRPGLRKASLRFVAAHPNRLPAPLVAEQVRGSGKPGFMQAVEALGTFPIEDRLAKIECPVLIVWGKKDMLVPLRDADRYLKAIGSNASKIVYEDTGHVAMLERPERFNADVEAFLLADQPEPAQ